MARMIKEITGSNSTIVHIEQRPGQTMKEAIRSYKAKELFGWEAEVSFREGLEQVYQILQRERKEPVTP